MLSECAGIGKISPCLCFGNNLLRLALIIIIASTIKVVANSATGSASHRPSSFRKCSSKNMLATANTPVRISDIMPDVKPSDTAVNSPDATMFTPINK